MSWNTSEMYWNSKRGLDALRSLDPATMLFVEQEANYADEFTAGGFRIMSAEKLLAHFENVEKCVHFPTWVPFGSNEDMTFDDLDDYVYSFRFIPLGSSEVAVFNKYFRWSYGMFMELEPDCELYAEEEAEMAEEE